MPRQLDNWLETFLNWTIPRSEAPTSLLIWSGLFGVGAVAKRKVVFSRKLLGSYDIYPNLYVVFVGPAGAVRKSTTAGYAEDLMAHVEDVFVGPTAGSDSKFVEILSKTEDGSMILISSEFANLVKTSPEGMYNLLTELFDNRPYYQYSTRSYADERVENPHIALLACTTPSWISHNTAYMIGGGFASRVIFVFEEEPRQRELYYDEVDIVEMDKLEKKLINDLQHISTLKGEFRHESKALKEEMREWYIDHSASQSADDRVAGYFNRKHLHLHKVCMILSLCERDDLVVTKDHFEKGLKLLDYVEKKLPRALISVGRNPFAADLQGILDFIRKERGEVPRSAIVKQFIHNVTEEQLGQILHALSVMQEVEMLPASNSKEVRYKAKTGKV